MKSINQIMLILAIMLVANTGGPLQAMETDKDQLNKALLQAAQAGNTNEVIALTNQGADVNHQSRFSDSALILAAQMGHPKIVRVLIEKGADPYQQSGMGYTALLFAANLLPIRLSLETCTILVEAMLKLTKEQKDTVYTLIASLERTPSLQTSKDTRELIAQKLINEYKKENRAKTRAEIEKIENGELRNQLLQLLEEK